MPSNEEQKNICTIEDKTWRQELDVTLQKIKTSTKSRTWDYSQPIS